MTALPVWHRRIVLLALLPAVTSCQPQPTKAPTPPAQVKDYLPAKVNFLKELATSAPGPDRARVTDPNSKETRRARGGAIGWIVRIIQRDWLPPDPNILHKQVVMIQNAFGPNDVTYSQWEAHGHILQVAQTATVMLIRVRPSSSDAAPQLTKETRVALARDTVTHLIRSQVDVIETTSRDRRKVEKAIMPDVLAASFEHADIQSCADGVHGKGTPQILGVRGLLYWWRCINWWTDGNEVGLYFLKAQGPPSVPRYNAGLDATWFEGSPYKNKSGRSDIGLPPRR